MRRLLAAILAVLLSASQAWAAITLNSLTGNFSIVAQSTAYTTASVTAHANRLILLCVYAEGRTTPVVAPTIAGFSATWVQVGNAVVTGTNEIFLFRTMIGGDQTGTVSITPGGGLTWDSATWSLAEFIDVSTTGTNGSGAVVQTVTSDLLVSGTSLTTTLAAYSHADNRPYLCSGERIGQGDQDFLPSDGATQIHDIDSGSAPQIFTMWDAATADTTPTFTWQNTDPDASAIAIEIKSSTADVAPGTRRPMAPVIFR